MKKSITKILFSLLAAVGILSGSFVLLLLVNDFGYGDQMIIPEGDSKTQMNKKTINLITWNIGYAGLGAEADFKADGGKRIFPVSREHTESHINAMVDFARKVKRDQVDFFILQEVAKKSSFIFKKDPYFRLSSAMEDYYAVYSPSVDVKWFPLIGSLHTGNVLFSRYQPEYTARHQLPQEKGLASIFNPKYNFLEARFRLPESDKEWVLVNLHLSAFDKGGLLRKKQLAVLSDFIKAEFAKGNYVVVGGDWNHRLIRTDFSYTTKEEYLFWVHDLPEDFTPPGWRWGVDPAVPTVRTNERPYRENENYTCIIDGFLVSPNVEIKSVQGYNLHFRDSDHNPVKITLAPKEN